ncbi:MAG: ComEC family competence protein [Cytophagia bacterium]|nr:ComEC family competence protein [Cytophagia bacterium]
MIGICIYANFPSFSNSIFYVFIILWITVFIGSFFKIRSLLSISFSLLLPISGYINARLNAPEILNFDLNNTNTFVFEVTDFPEIKPKSIALVVHCIAFLDHKKWKKGSGKFKIYVGKTANMWVRGTRLLVQTKLNPFPQPSFPFEKNWSEYFQAKGIYGSAFIAKNAFILLNDVGENKNIFYYFHSWQSYLAQHLAHAMHRGINLDVAKTMLLGVKSSIDFETMAVYSSLGAIHILSVSGLHVGLLYAGLSFIFGFLLRKGRYGKMLFFILMMILLWAYAGISGFSDPVLRSAWMFSVMLFAKAFLHHQNGINTLAFSCFVLLVFKPMALFEPGFQLSYLAVLGLIVFQQKWVSLIKFNFQYKPLQFITSNTWELTCVALAAQIFTWPLIIYYFYQFPNPFWFLLLNPILIVLSTISLGIGFLFISLSPILVFFKLDLFFHCLGFLLDFSFSMLHFVMFKFVYLFQPIMPFLKIHLVDVFIYFMLVTCFWCWLVYRERIFISLAILLIIAEGLFHIFPDRDHQQSYLSQYKGYPIFVSISGVKSHFFAPTDLSKDPLWIQGHLSPLWANLGVKDTLGLYYDQRINYAWIYKNKKFILLNKAAIGPRGYGTTVMVAKNALKKKPHWLRTWDYSTLLITNKPSIYTQQVWSTYYPKLLGNKVDFLDQRAAIMY